VEEQKNPATDVPAQPESAKKIPFAERLNLQEIVHSPIRKWLAWAGLALFVALIIAYYLTTGGQ
jgi:hypothetical protein